MSTEPLAELFAAVQASTKYRQVSPDLIRQIGERELAKGTRLKEAIKATKDKLHQVGGAFLEVDLPDARWLADLPASDDGDAAAWRSAILGLMRRHASTRERLPILTDFYAAAFAGLPPVTSVLDLACGLHPLGIPWMPLAPGAQYFAYDIYQGMMDLLNGFFPLAGVQGAAQVWDVALAVPTQPVEVAFILKALPCLEQIDPAAPRRIVDVVQAKRLVVSYPARSLGGRHKGMPTQYAARFRALVADKPWRITEHLFPSELVFVIDI